MWHNFHIRFPLSAELDLQAFVLISFSVYFLYYYYYYYYYYYASSQRQGSVLLRPSCYGLICAMGLASKPGM
jgi:hypothetical protein